MGEYLSEGGWTYLDGLKQPAFAERIGKKIMELGGVRATVFDYTHKREAGEHVDVCVEEIASSLNKQESAIARELRAQNQGSCTGCEKGGGSALIGGWQHPLWSGWMPILREA